MQLSEPAFVMIDGRKIAYHEVCPSAPQGTIVLITGLAAKRHGWYRQMAAFGETYRTIAIENRDVGDSDLVPQHYTIADMADDTAIVLGALGVREAFIVGISMGGFISLELTLRHPELVKKLVLISTSAGGKTHVQPRLPVLLTLIMPRLRQIEPGQRAQRNYQNITAPGYPERDPEGWADLAEIGRYRPQPREAYRRQLRASARHDVAKRLSEIHVPTLVLHGERDPLVRFENGVYLAKHIPGARMIRYPDTGHVPILERTDAVNRDLLAFFAESD